MFTDITEMIRGLVIAKSVKHILMKYGKETNGQPKLVYTSQHNGIGDGLRDESPMTTERP
ncbi:MAG: hypothetical protein ACI9UJ_002432 [bacterium]|jgi:hypothetical protein